MEENFDFSFELSRENATFTMSCLDSSVYIDFLIDEEKKQLKITGEKKN